MSQESPATPRSLPLRSDSPLNALRSQSQSHMEIKTQTLIFSHPPPRLSTSLASSPKIIEPDLDVVRMRSVRPEHFSTESRSVQSRRGIVMVQGRSPGVDFFDDASSGDESSEVGAAKVGHDAFDHDSSDSAWIDDDGDDNSADVGEVNDKDTDAWSDTGTNSSRESLATRGRKLVRSDKIANRAAFDTVQAGNKSERFPDFMSCKQEFSQNAIVSTNAVDHEGSHQAKQVSELELRKSPTEGKEQARSVSLRRLNASERPKVIHHAASSSNGFESRRSSPLKEVFSERDPGINAHWQRQEGNDIGRRQRVVQREALGSSNDPSIASLRARSYEHDRQARKMESRGRHRRNTSESLYSTLQAHAMTLAAIESMSPLPSLSSTRTARSRTIDTLPVASNRRLPIQESSSFTKNRHINIAAISTAWPDWAHDATADGQGSAEWEEEEASNGQDVDDEGARAMIRFPFTYKKSPYPLNRSRHSYPSQYRRRNDIDDAGGIVSQGTRMQRRLRKESRDFKPRQAFGLEPSAGKHWSMKGKQVLGLVGADRVNQDLTTKYAQDAFFPGGSVAGKADLSFKFEEQPRRTVNITKEYGGTGKEVSAISEEECVVWLSLRNRHGDTGVAKRVERIVVPANLTMSLEAKNKSGGSRYTSIDFDDKYLAELFREGYRKLAGSWTKRCFSARTLRYIQLDELAIWSGIPVHSSRPYIHGLLGARDGFSEVDDGRVTLTEENLLKLFRHPQLGKARYTWVHWARKLMQGSRTQHAECHTRLAQVERDLSGIEKDNQAFPPSTLPNAIPTIQFVCSFSVQRILLVIATMLVLSIASALSWVFFGATTWRGEQGHGRPERVGPGLLLGLLVLILESVAFGVWISLSWYMC